MCKEHNVDQLIGASVDYINQTRIQSLLTQVENVVVASEKQLSRINFNYNEALKELNSGKLKIDEYILKNRGGEKGLHGFIAEAAQASISNSKKLMDGFKKEIQHLDDNGKADLLINNEPVQVKFYNSIPDGLATAKNYDDMAMMYPKDTMDIIKKVLAKEKHIETKDGVLSAHKIEKISNLIEDESKRRSLPPEKWLMSSTLDYEEVQKGKISATMSRENQTLRKEFQDKKSHTLTEKEKSVNKIRQNHKANFKEANKAALVGASIQGGITLGYEIYNKSKEGKNVWQYNIDDWQELGLSSGKSAIKGYVTGSSIYLMTNTLGLSAPLASAATSATFNLVNTIKLYRKNEIDEQGFIDSIISSSFDLSGATIGAIIGEAIIPIPILGAVIGTSITSSVLQVGKDILNKSEKNILLDYLKQIERYATTLNIKHQEKYNNLVSKYQVIFQQQDFVFDLSINVKLRFMESIEMAYLVGVNEEEILQDIEDIDRYFLN